MRSLVLHKFAEYFLRYKPPNNNIGLSQEGTPLDRHMFK